MGMMKKLELYVERNVASLLAEMFVTVADGCTVANTHYIADFTSLGTKSLLGYSVGLSEISLDVDESSLGL